MEELIPTNERNEKQPQERRILIGVLSALVVVIVGLVVAIVMSIRINNEKSIVPNEDLDSSVVALNLRNDIFNRMVSEADYSFDDAVNDFENAINGGSGELKTNIMIYYAYFLEENGYDLGLIVGMLEDYISEDTSVDERVELYFVLEDFYSKLGDYDKLKKIDEEINLLSPGEKVSSEQLLEDVDEK